MENGLIQKIKIEKIIKIVILAGVFALIFWGWSFKETFIPKPSEFFFAIAVLTGLGYLIFGHNLSKLKYLKQSVWIVLFLFLFSIILATVISYFRFNLTFHFGGLGYLARLFFGFFIFIPLFIFLKEDLTFYKKIYTAFYLPLIIYIPFLFFPPLANKLSMLSDGVRFQGFSSSPNAVAPLLIIGFALVFILFLKEALEGFKRKPLFIFYGLVLVGFEMLILWTFSRAYFIAMWPVIIFGSILMCKLYKKNLKQTFFYLIASVVIALMVIIFSPTYIHGPVLKNFAASKNIFLHLNEANNTARVIVKQTLPSGYERQSFSFNLPEVIAPAGQTRLLALLYYKELFLRDPLSFIFGLGLNYEKKFTFVSLVNGTRAIEGAESIIDIFIFGGVFLATSLFLLGLFAIKNIWHKLLINKSGATYILGSGMALLGLWTAAIFLGSPLFAFYFWILLAMVLV